MNNRNIILWIVAVVLASLFLIGILTNLQESKKVNVGVILPLTGAIAKTGSDAKIALEVAQADFPGSNISLVFEDDSFTPTQSVSAFNKLLNLNSVVAVIGPLNGSSIESVRSLAVANKIPVFTPYGSANEIGDYLYKNSSEVYSEDKFIADKMDNLGYKNVAIIYFLNDFGIKHSRYFKEAVVSNGGEIVADESYPVGSNDFRTVLTKIKTAKPEALYVINVGAGVGQITKQAFELGLKAPFFGQYGTEASDLLTVGGESLEGMIYTSEINEGYLSDKQKRFIAEFERRAGISPSIVAYNTYDIYSILVKAVDVCRADSICINKYIANIKDFEGVSGKFSILNRLRTENLYP